LKFPPIKSFSIYCRITLNTASAMRLLKGGNSCTKCDSMEGAGREP